MRNTQRRGTKERNVIYLLIIISCKIQMCILTKKIEHADCEFFKCYFIYFYPFFEVFCASSHYLKIVLRDDLLITLIMTFFLVRGLMQLRRWMVGDIIIDVGKE